MLHKRNKAVIYDRALDWREAEKEKGAFKRA